MKTVRLILAAALFAGSTAGLAVTGSKYYLVLTDVLGSSAANFAGPYSSKAACESDEKTFQDRAGNSPSVYICVLRKKAEIDAITDAERQELAKNMLNTK